MVGRDVSHIIPVGDAFCVGECGAHPTRSGFFRLSRIRPRFEGTKKASALNARSGGETLQLRSSVGEMTWKVFREVLGVSRIRTPARRGHRPASGAPGRKRAKQRGSLLNPYEMLRHSTATEWMRRGASEREVQELLSHRTRHATPRYARLADERLESIVGRRRDGD